MDIKVERAEAPITSVILRLNLLETQRLINALARSEKGIVVPYPFQAHRLRERLENDTGYKNKWGVE